MTIDEAYTLVQHEQPQVLYLSGKTSTGKSTFAAGLARNMGYAIIALDDIVRQSVIAPFKLTDQGQAFVEVYGNREQTTWLAAFYAATQARIKENLQAGQHVVIDGAIGNPLTAQEMLGDLPTTVLYFHPENLNSYERNLTKRFRTTGSTSNGGLPLNFWKLIPKDAFAQFVQDKQLTPALVAGIQEYAVQSREVSKKRLAEFKHYFPDVQVVIV